jgi:hypothetical protein
VAARGATKSADPLPHARALFQLGTVCGKQGKFEDARPLLEEALAVQREKLGDLNPETMATQEALSATVRSAEVRGAITR